MRDEADRRALLGRFGDCAGAGGRADTRDSIHRRAGAWHVCGHMHARLYGPADTLTQSQLG